MSGSQISTHSSFWRLVGPGLKPDKRLWRWGFGEHRRDTVLVLVEGGLEAELRERRIRFVDLNRNEIRKVPLQTSFTVHDCLWLPRTVLTSDLIALDA
jgi:hypothetical protein